MSEIIFKVIESDDGGFEARTLRHSFFTQGEDWNRSKGCYEKPCNAISAETTCLGVLLRSSLAQKVHLALLQTHSDLR